MLCIVGLLGKCVSLWQAGEFSGERAVDSVQTLPSSGRGDQPCSPNLPRPPCQSLGTWSLRVGGERELRNTFPNKKLVFPGLLSLHLAFEMFAPLKVRGGRALAWSPFLKQRSQLTSENLREHCSGNHELQVQVCPLLVLICVTLGNFLYVLVCKTELDCSTPLPKLSRDCLG